jgi:hypothetical protein
MISGRDLVPGRQRMRLVSAAFALAVCGVPSADAKLGLRLSLSTDTPRVRHAVRVVVRTAELPGADCRMRLLAVAPGESAFEALDAFVSGGYSVNGPQGSTFHALRPTPRMGFMRALSRERPTAWRATIRFPKAGRWRLIVPNWCGPGYVYPSPVDRLLTVR